MKKDWQSPQFIQLGAEKTEEGNSTPKEPDAIKYEGDTTWYSFPSPRPQ